MANRELRPIVQYQKQVSARGVCGERPLSVPAERSGLW